MQLAAPVRQRMALAWRATPGLRAASWPLLFWQSPREHSYYSMKREHTWQSYRFINYPASFDELKSEAVGRTSIMSYYYRTSITRNHYRRKSND
jgi:hypothetical protein